MVDKPLETILIFGLVSNSRILIPGPIFSALTLTLNLRFPQPLTLVLRERLSLSGAENLGPGTL